MTCPPKMCRSVLLVIPLKHNGRQLGYWPVSHCTVCGAARR